MFVNNIVLYIGIKMDWLYKGHNENFQIYYNKSHTIVD